ncbi:ran-specific GTPase-activating protein-like isoform X1 [Amphibalanus amphitrite]|nr:ran-specific GTPase-activating protein-like isoform X1 [Amphibalanus amphitrite]XP_043215988.1 ran-specific GTPase-activating protein-like isoform X1 [Amphibalanus amphitrite]XP_043215989.1 ran-specific GTPase-activating protein-like isoform X1 [Amphibalanus amphitrite]XP_043215990.1 ran-specific GTPase-activating protein-like isoform X1 [Amphibalanus amphitrite]XP_043215993.1 ran-specific GTPase-activating protein-like isoform X1 [Amphibalanus amphitrite]XP_043215994.1 ran-specific GTPase-
MSDKENQQEPESSAAPEAGEPAPAKSAPAAGDEDEEPEAAHDPHYEPIVSLPLVELPDSEADEETLLQLRAKLYRMDRSGEQPEWKERGTGDVKILRHKSKPRARLLMRRDKTLKVCANHFVTQNINLMPNCGSDRAWVWSVACDFSDEEPKSEMLAIRFANAENAKKFKEVFTEAQKITREDPTLPEEATEEREAEPEPEPETEAPGGVTDKLASLTVREGAES